MSDIEQTPQPEWEEPTDDVEVELTEPAMAVRNSPTAIAALIVALVAFWMSRDVAFVFVGAGGGNLQQLLRSIVVAVMPAAGGVIAFWLVLRAEDEIDEAGGRLGGVGFCRAARIVSLSTLAIVAVAIVLGVVAGPP